MIGVAGVYASFGLLMTSTGALVPSIRDDLDLSRGQMGFILGAWQLAYIGASVPAGRFIDRVGLRRALTWSIAVMVASTVLRAASQDFLSMLAAVALLGVTGERGELSSTATDVAARCRTLTDRPVLVGVGVSDPDQARAVCDVADGVVVGSALMRRVLEGGGADAAAEFVGELRRAIDAG